MSQTTDTPEFARGFLWQVVLICIIALGLVFLLSSGFPLNIQVFGSRVETTTALLPWIVAGGQTIANGLSDFSGEQPVILAVAKAKAIVGLLLFVVGPTVVFLGLRRRSIGENLWQQLQPWHISHVLFGLCTAFVLVFACAIPYMAIRGEEVRHSLREAQAPQNSRDRIINEMNLISIDAAQFFVLPEELGGGNRTLLSYQLRPELAESAEAMYTSRIEAANIHVRAVSRRYADSWVEVTIDSAGRMNGWIFGGKFH